MAAICLVNTAHPGQSSLLILMLTTETEPFLKQSCQENQTLKYVNCNISQNIFHLVKLTLMTISTMNGFITYINIISFYDDDDTRHLILFFNSRHYFIHSFFSFDNYKSRDYFNQTWISLFFQNTDASLLPTVGWPAFAIHEMDIRDKTVSKVCRKLQGRFGIKRFLRDGYKTVTEDTARKYYKPAEIKVRFDHFVIFINIWKNI